MSFCRECAENPFGKFLRLASTGNRSDQKSSEMERRLRRCIEAGIQARSEEEVKLVVARWKEYAHPRALLYSSNPQILEETVAQLAMSIDADDDPVLGSEDGCVHWHGEVEDDLQPIIRMIKPGESEESIIYVNRTLAFIFAEDDSFEQLRQFFPPPRPFEMTCRDRLCVNLAHISLPVTDMMC